MLCSGIDSMVIVKVVLEIKNWFELQKKVANDLKCLHRLTLSQGHS